MHPTWVNKKSACVLIQQIFQQLRNSHFNQCFCISERFVWELLCIIFIHSSYIVVSPPYPLHVNVSKRSFPPAGRSKPPNNPPPKKKTKMKIFGLPITHFCSIKWGVYKINFFLSSVPQPFPGWVGPRHAQETVPRRRHQGPVDPHTGGRLGPFTALGCERFGGSCRKRCLPTILLDSFSYCRIVELRRWALGHPNGLGWEGVPFNNFTGQFFLNTQFTVIVSFFFLAVHKFIALLALDVPDFFFNW